MAAGTKGGAAFTTLTTATSATAQDTSTNKVAMQVNVQLTLTGSGATTPAIFRVLTSTDGGSTYSTEAEVRSLSSQSFTIHVGSAPSRVNVELVQLASGGTISGTSLASQLGWSEAV